jgi:hypothetical protein
MPGVRPWGFRPGDSAELLAECILGCLAFTSRVPRTEDVGHDLLCSIAERDGNLLKAGPFFTVQVKSTRDVVKYSGEHELEWIRGQENPFFLAIVDRSALCLEMYSTWNMLNGFLLRGAKCVVLQAGGPEDVCGEVVTAVDESEQRIPLGKPILRITAQDVMNPAKAQDYARILRQWVELDRENIVNRHASMYWINGPAFYQTNHPLGAETQFRVAFYWNAKNLYDCLVNFGRSATALRLVIRRRVGEEGERSAELSGKIAALEQALRSIAEQLDPFSKTLLRDNVGLNFEDL